MEITIGILDGKRFNLDVEILADTRALITASSGAGKSYLLRGLAEKVADKIPTILIDPEGEFPTLREKLDILIVTENRDLKPDIKSAGLLARKLVEMGISAVIDIYDLPGKGDPWDKRRLFVYAFLTGLMNIPKNMYHPMLVAIDEAHNFAMESPSKGGKELTKQYFKLDESPSLLSRSAVRNLMSAGRKRGIGGLLATQRISKIDKDSIADARNTFIGGTNLDIDQERAADMLGIPKRASVSLRDLAPGEFYCFGPAFGKRGVLRFHSSEVKTTHPQAGKRIDIEVPKASSKISQILAQFGDLPHEVEIEEKSITSMQSEIQKLRRELSVRSIQDHNIPKIERVEVPILTDDHLVKLSTLILAMNEEGKGIQDVAVSLAGAAKAIADALAAYKHNNNNIHTSSVYPNKHETSAVPNTKTITGEKITTPEQRILDAIAWFESIGIYEPRQEAVAFLAGYTYGGGAFNNPRGRLNTRGYVVYRGKNIGLTDDGRRSANIPEYPLTQTDLHNHILSVLPKPHRVIMEKLITLYPNHVDKEDLSNMVGKRGGAFNNPLGRLRSFGLIEYPERGTVVALPFLFME